MRILGIDPGSRRTGWGVVQLEGTKLRQIGAGTIKVAEKLPLAKRLHLIHQGLEQVVHEYGPEAVAVEEIFFARYPNAALKLGHARGVALLVASQCELEVHEYPPAIVKRTVVGRGAADKTQVTRLITALLGLKTPPEEDAADALAVAITHIQAYRSKALGR
ncbi:MAG: crossover junction endodeoxyribonuclease RuvC [Myxococcales bacterium]|nr:crossover junction endodeoxyribonuclease RuvC [Myxococcales bacterium]